MVVVPDAPRVPRQAGNLGGFSAPGVVAPEDFTGKQITQMGQAELGAGVAIRRTALAEIQKINRSRAREVSVQVESEDLDAIFSLRKLKGRAGIDAAQQVLEGFSQRSVAARDRLDNDEQRNAFDEKRASDFLSFKSEVESYRAKQIDFEDEVTTAASLAQAENSAVAYHNTITDAVVGFDQNPQHPPRPTVQQQFDASNAKRMDAVIAEAYYMAQRKGITDRTALEVFIRERTTVVHARIMENLLENSSPAEAQKYLETNKSQISAPVQLELMKRVESSKVDEAGAALSRELQNTPLLAALDAIQNSDFSIDVKDNASRRLEHMDTVRRQQTAIQKNEVYDEAITWLSLDENRGKPYVMMPEALKTAIGNTTGVADKVSIWIQDGGQRKTTEAGLTSILRLRADPSPLKNLTFDELRDTMSLHWDDKTMAQAAGMWAEVNQKPVPENMKADRVHDFTQQALLELFYLPRDRAVSPLERNRADRIELEVKTRVRDANNGAGIPNTPAGDQQLKEIISQILLKERGTASVDLDLPSGFASENTASLFAMFPEELAGVYYDTSSGKISKQEVEDVTQATNRLAREAIANQNRAIMVRNSTKGEGEVREALVDTSNPEVLANAIGSIRQARIEAQDRAFRWLTAFRNNKIFYEGAEVRGWDDLPDELAQPLRELEVESRFKEIWQSWDWSHDQAGRVWRGSGGIPEGPYRFK